MTADEDLLLLLKFAMFRFSGTMPNDNQLMHCIEDWKREAYPNPNRAHNLKLRAESKRRANEAGNATPKTS